MGVPGLQIVEARDDDGAAAPVVALAHTLDEDAQVHAFPVEVQTRAVLKAWRGVADALEVAMVVERAGAGVDALVAVQVLILHIAGAIVEPSVGLVVELVGAIGVGQLVGRLGPRGAGLDKVVVDIPQLLDVSVLVVDEVAGLVQAVGLIAPDFAILLARIQSIDAIGRAGYLGVLDLVVAQGGLEVEVQAIGELVVEVECDFPSLILKLGIVLLGRCLTEGRRQCVARGDDVAGDAVVPVERQT